MTAGRWYLAGLAAVGLVALILTRLLGPEHRDAAGYGILIGLVVQAPLGWWTIRSIGTERFQLAWVAGMVIRLMVVVLAAVVLAPEYGWNTGATLAGLVSTLLVLLLVEVLIAVREQSGITSR
ncbi:MAG TPA: hypothetical protein VF252_12920 [Gemmatimonadales bacterium]